MLASYCTLLLNRLSLKQHEVQRKFIAWKDYEAWRIYQDEVLSGVGQAFSFMTH